MLCKKIAYINPVSIATGFLLFLFPHQGYISEKNDNIQYKQFVFFKYLGSHVLLHTKDRKENRHTTVFVLNKALQIGMNFILYAIFKESGRYE